MKVTTIPELIPYRYHDYAVAFQSISKALLQRVAFSALIGESGTGKTTLVRQLKPTIDRNNGIILYSTLATSSSYGLLQMIADTLHLSLRRSKQETLKMIIQTLSIMSHNLYLWLDEAQFMSAEIFHEIRMLAEASLDAPSLFSVLFIGQPELKQKLKTPQLFSMTRRINPIAHLNGLLREEMTPFMLHTFTQQVAQRFTPEALSLLFEQSGANPAKIVRIAQNCLSNYTHIDIITHDIISQTIDYYCYD